MILKEGDSVVIDSDKWDLNGKVGTIQWIEPCLNRCQVITENGVHTLPLNEVSPRTFLSEQK